MRFLFVAPEICTPLTEGRKRYVLDLIEALKPRHDVSLLTTTEKDQKTLVDAPLITSEHGTPGGHLTAIIRHLPTAIRSGKPDIVVLFPYGTFRHLYGIASILFIRAIDMICRTYRIPCITLMYSIDGSISIRTLARFIPKLAISYPDTENTLNINVGIRCRGTPLTTKNKNTRKILFMAGAWQDREERLKYIINIRGLGILLQIGSVLSESGIGLIVASPLFRSTHYRDLLINHHLNSWPPSKLELSGQVRVPEIFDKCDLFVFPYQEDTTHFIPTSVLEAMCAGCCTAVTDQPFLRHLSQNGNTLHLLPRDDPAGIAQQITFLVNDRHRRFDIGINAMKYAINNWSIEHSAKQLEACAAKILGD